MHPTELKNLRKAAESVTRDGRYMLKSKGVVVMFDLTKERAENYAKLYKQSEIVLMPN